MSRVATAIQKNRREEGQNTPRRAKSRLPEPQVLRIMQRHVTGESHRQIARAEAVDRKTVARVVGSQEFQNHIRLQRERFYALVPAALDALQYALKERKDSRIAYQILADTGVIPSAEERTSALTQPPLTISDEAREILLAALSRKDRMLFDVFAMYQKKAEAYGLPEDSIYPPTHSDAKTADSTNEKSSKIS